jgi:hypothetical protein
MTDLFLFLFGYLIGAASVLLPLIFGKEKP